MLLVSPPAVRTDCDGCGRALYPDSLACCGCWESEGHCQCRARRPHSITLARLRTVLRRDELRRHDVRRAPAVGAGRPGRAWR